MQIIVANKINIVNPLFLRSLGFFLNQSQFLPNKNFFPFPCQVS